jgi:penicillin amidase
MDKPPPVLVSPPHGPIISLDAAHGVAVSARWTGQESETDDFHAFLRLNAVSSVDDGRQALEGDLTPDGGRYTGYYTGAQNFVLADDQGNIAYVPHACVPQRPWATSMAVYPYPVIPMDGRGNFEWASGPDGGLLCVPDDELPRAIGSAKGYLATANADPIGTGKDGDPYAGNQGDVPYLSFDWQDPIGFRAARIRDVLDAKTANGGKVTLADMKALQTDHVVTLARPFLAYIEGIDAASSSDTNVASAAAMLLSWGAADAGSPLDCPTGLAPGSLDPVAAINDQNATNSANSASCLLFHTFLRRVLEQTFSDEERVAGVGRNGGNEIRALLALLSGIPNPNNIFCRDVNAAGQTVANKTCAQQVTDALAFSWMQLKNAYGDVGNWRWGRLHTATMNFVVSPYPFVDPGFHPGPYPRPGGVQTVDVGDPGASASSSPSFAFRSSANIRWIAAMDGTVDHTFMQLPGVQSGNAYPFGQQTMLTDWVLNQYFQWPFRPTDVTSVRSETFSP